MKLKRFMIAKSYEHGLSVSSCFPSSMVMYGIGPSSLYEVIPGKSSWFCRRVAGDYLSHSGIISTMAASGGNLPVNTVRSQIGG